MQIKLIVVGNVKEIFYQNKIEEFQKQINKKMSIQLICLKDESIPKQTSETVIRKIKETEGERNLWDGLMGRRWIIPKSKKVLQQQNREANQVLHL